MPDRPVKTGILALVRTPFKFCHDHRQIMVRKPAYGRSKNSGQRDILHGIVDDGQHI